MPTKKTPTRNILRKARFFLPVLFLVFLLVPQFVQAQQSTVVINRSIQDFLDLWGNKDAWIDRTRENGLEDLKKARGNGIGYIAPKTEGGFDKEGNLKKISAVISLTINDQSFNGTTGKRRAWNMVGSTYYHGTDLFSNRVYLRFIDEAFIARIYQKDTSNNPVNISIVKVPVCSFLSCDGGIEELVTRFGMAAAGKPSDKVVKYGSGSALFAGAPTDIYEDGYRNGPAGDAPLSTGAAAGTGAVIGTYIFPGIGTVTGAVLGVVANALIDTDGPVLIMRQTAVVTLPIKSSLEKDRLTYVDLWYAGQQRETTGENSIPKPAGYPDQIPNNPDTGNERIKYLGTTKLSKNLPYFQIGGVFEFKTPKDLEDAQTQAEEGEQEVGEIGNNITTNDNRVLPICNITSIGQGSVMGCVAQILYHGIFRPVAFFAQLMGKLFDYFMYYSLSDESYRHEFIQTGWQLVRDISNIFFILVMVWSGLVAVFNTSNVSYKKVIPTLIINALIINFSLFATRVVIDISNITARIFYNQMVVKVGGKPYAVAGEEKPISAAIVSSFNPQNIFQGKVLMGEAGEAKDKNNKSNADFNSQSTATLEASKFKRGSREYAGYFSLVTLIAIFISFGVGMMFWKTAFIFVGRVIGLYVAMIFSPFAFLSRGGVPLVSKIDAINYGAWWKDLINYATLAPIFVFFLYIINSFLNVEFFNKVGLDQNSSDFFTSVMHVLIPMLIIYGLVTKAVGIAKKHAGEFGEMAQKFAVNTTKIAGGVALGGTALVGRAAMSGLSKGLGTWAATNKDNNFFANRTNRLLQWGQKSSLDVRNTKVFGALGGLGIKTDDRFASALGVGQKDALKGNVGLRKEREKRKEEETTEKNDMSHLTDAQVKKVWGKMSERKAKAEAEKKWEEDRMKELKDSKPELKVLEDAATDLSAKLKEAITSKNTTEEKSLKEQLAKNAQDQQTILAPLVTTMLAEKKDDAHHETEEYKKKLKDAENKIKSDYGEIKTAKDLSSAMRYDYAKRMLEESLLLSKGEKRGWLAPGGGAATTTAGMFYTSLGLATGGASVVAGGIVADYIDNQQEAAKNTYNKIIRDFEKAHNPEKNRSVKLKKQLEEIDELIKGHVEKVIEGTGKAFEDLNEEDRKKHFDKARSDAQATAFTMKDEYDDFRKKYAREKGTMSEEEKKAGMDKIREMADAYRKAKDESDALDNAHKDKEWVKSEIEKEEEKAKNAEEKKKGGGKEDKPKDEK